ncbi:MAG: VOC family protein [Phycisphaerales bacterium]|nr:VOC family protein [Phycisphaerales bacterium]
MRHIGRMAIVVRDYDEAIRFYTEKLGFVVREDTDLGGGKRWVRVAPSNGSNTELLLARAVTPEQRARIGDQTGGRVFVFLETDDFWRDYEAMSERGVTFCRPPKEEPYGMVAVFLDLYGNKFDLIQPNMTSEQSMS